MTFRTTFKISGISGISGQRPGLNLNNDQATAAISLAFGLGLGLVLGLESWLGL